MERIAVLGRPAEAAASRELGLGAAALPIPNRAGNTAGNEFVRTASDGEDDRLNAALQAVEREQYLRQVKLETDVALFGYYADPFSGR